MAKMKKKGTGRNRKKEKDKGYYALYFIVAFDMIFYFAYMNLFELIFLKVYSPDYFVSSKYNIVLYLFIVFFLITIASAVIPSFLQKELKKKFIICSTVASIIVLAVITIFNCNVWSFNKDSFSYNTILQKDKIVYSYDDIDSIEVEENRYLFERRNHHIDYTFYMKDGRKFKIDAYEVFCEDDSKVIEFDKSVSSKRKLVDDYYYSGNASQELNDYYSTIFDNKQRY